MIVQLLDAQAIIPMHNPFNRGIVKITSKTYSITPPLISPARQEDGTRK